ncbi:MAG: hypothetical protein AAF655_02680 [Bacteroidota bacterium]
MSKSILHASLLSLGVIAFHFAYHPHYLVRQFHLYAAFVFLPLLLSLFLIDTFASPFIGTKRNGKRAVILAGIATLLSFTFQFVGILRFHYVNGFQIDAGVHLIPALFSVLIVAPSMLVGEWIHAKLKYPLLAALLIWGLCFLIMTHSPERTFIVRQPLFSLPKSQGTVINPYMKEASGLAMSRARRGYFWTHNDFGNPGNIFLLSPTGETVATIRLDSLSHRDWEDMAAGPGPTDSLTYLYLADIGDNFNVFPVKYIHRIAEPQLSKNGQWEVPEAIETIAVKYPDFPHDAETLLLDPFTMDLYLFTKRRAQTNVYKLKYPYSHTIVNELQKVGTLPFYNIVSGDISPEGTEILLKTYFGVYYWERKRGESVEEALEREPVRVPYIPEAQGEALCWDLIKGGYYTLSEYDDKWPQLLYYSRRSQK